MIEGPSNIIGIVLWWRKCLMLKDPSNTMIMYYGGENSKW